MTKSPSINVSATKDMKEIRERVAREFTKEFTKVLSSEGGHQVVTDAGDGVLILRPAIIRPGY